MKVIARKKKEANDEKLWEQLRRGDQYALEILFKRYYAMLYDYGMKIINKQECVKDSIQEVFAYIWEKRNALSDAKSVPAYLMVSLRRKLFDYIRKRNRQNETVHQLEYNYPESAFSVEDIWIINEEEQEKKQALKIALSQIPPRMSEAIYLKKISGLSYKEIASIMNISSQAARNYVSEAFQRLRTILDPTSITS